MGDSPVLEGGAVLLIRSTDFSLTGISDNRPSICAKQKFEGVA